MEQSLHIGQVSRQSGVSVDAIRFYQKLGLIGEPTRSDVGYRLFSSEQVHDLQFIRHAQELGFSLREIKELLMLRQKPHACSQVRLVLKRKVADVRQKIQALTRIELDLKTSLRRCERELRLGRVSHPDCCPTLERLDGTSGSKRTQ